jgi:hypothetical protein
MAGIIGKFREFRQSKHAAEQIYALAIESKAGQEFIFGDDPRGEVRRYPVRINEFLVERTETGIGKIIYAVEPVARVIGRVARLVDIGGVGPGAWWSGSGGEVKAGG